MAGGPGRRGKAALSVTANGEGAAKGQADLARTRRYALSGSAGPPPASCSKMPPGFAPRAKPAPGPSWAPRVDSRPRKWQRCWAWRACLRGVLARPARSLSRRSVATAPSVSWPPAPRARVIARSTTRPTRPHPATTKLTSPDPSLPYRELAEVAAPR